MEAENESLKYLKNRDAKILNWIKETAFLLGFGYVCYAYFSERGFFFVLALYMFARMGFSMLFNRGKNDTKDPTIWSIFIYLWKVATIFGCAYLLIFYNFIGLAIGVVFAMLSSIVWFFAMLAPDRKKENEKPPILNAEEQEKVIARWKLKNAIKQVVDVQVKELEDLRKYGPKT